MGEMDKRRKCLPAKMVNADTSIWSVIKSNVGKDLSRITIPVQYCEPLSFLQRISEYLEYGDILDNINSDDPQDRIQAVAAFAVSALASNWNRIGKPLNPLLGETYQLKRNGYKFFANQVSHHPPISAFHCESDQFVFHGWIQPKLKLWGKSIEIHPKGILKVHLKKYNENYSWKNVDCTVHNLIVGKLWIEHHGSMEVKCTETNLMVNLSFKPAGWFSSELHRVEGFISDIDNKKNKKRFIYGRWTEWIRSTDMASYEEYAKTNAHKFRLLEPSTGGGNDIKKSPSTSPSASKRVLQKFNSLSIRNFSLDNAEADEPEPPVSQDAESQPQGQPENIDIPNSSLLWEVTPRPENSSEYYNFTSLTMTLNEMGSSLDQEDLCPTDSRFRPDIRRLEEGDLEGAAVEKQALEEAQRKFLKKNPEEGLPPLWFSKNSAEDDWELIEKVWDPAVRSKVVKNCPFPYFKYN